MARINKDQLDTTLLNSTNIGVTVQAYDATTTKNTAVQALTNKDLTTGNTFPTFNQNTTGKSATTDALNSTTTAVNVSSATAPSTGQVLTATSSTAATWQAPASGFTNPMTTLGDVIYENATPAPARLPGQTTTVKQFLSQTGNGTVSAAPAWSSLVVSNITNLGTNVGILLTGAANGSGSITGSTSPTLTTPIITSAGATLNGSTSGATVIKASAVAGTTTATLPATTGNVMLDSSTDTITGVKTFGAAGNVGKLVVAGTTSGTTVLNASAVAGTTTLTLPAATDTLAGKATTDAFTNKTITDATNSIGGAALNGQYRQNTQADTTNTTQTALVFKDGWGYVSAASGTSAAKAITFPTAFSTAVVGIEFGMLGFVTGTAPTVITSFNTAIGGETLGLSATAISTTGFTLNAYKTTAYSSATNFYGFWWRAIGT